MDKPLDTDPPAVAGVRFSVRRDPADRAWVLLSLRVPSFACFTLAAEATGRAALDLIWQFVQGFAVGTVSPPAAERPAPRPPPDPFAVQCPDCFALPGAACSGIAPTAMHRARLDTFARVACLPPSGLS